MSAAVERIWALREQAAYLRAPERRTGPSPAEAEQAAEALEREADDLAETLFDGGVK